MVRVYKERENEASVFYISIMSQTLMRRSLRTGVISF